FTGRPDFLMQLVEAYTKEQGLFHTAQAPEAVYSDIIELDLGTVEPSLAGPTRPQDRVRLSEAKKSFEDALKGLLSKAVPKPAPKEVKRLETEGGAQTAVTGGTTQPLALPPKVQQLVEKGTQELDHGRVVIAAITSCTNTSNPSVMMAAGLLA